ncbi:LysR family transcriptional regulator [Raoultibacter phocaeensis]|uniref:LysR family transcriptional regulator n=1 Tax=Raoultibacter phocaeensis TaxID=2479841 RepID=UPI0015D6328F|nr:LysR family transcriptional regulator [Raoultibacter phocaeensis]
MRIESLQYFLEVAKTGSFSLAARQLYVSQQGLSKAVQTLERELGVDLFERMGKRIRLTDAGRDLVPLARTCIEDQKALEEAMRMHAERSQAHEPMRLIAMPFAASGLFTLMKDVLEVYGLRDVILVEKSLPEILHDAAAPARRSATAAMVVVPDRMLACLEENLEADYVPLFRSNIVIAGTKALLSPRKRAYSIDEIARMPIAYYNEPVLETILGDMFHEHPFEQVIMHASNLSMINEYVASGRAVTFSDSFSAYMSENDGETLSLPIKGAASFTVGFVYAPDADTDGCTRSYIDRFKSCIEEACGPYLAKHPLTGARRS